MSVRFLYTSEFLEFLGLITDLKNTLKMLHRKILSGRTKFLIKLVYIYKRVCYVTWLNLSKFYRNDRFKKHFRVQFSNYGNDRHKILINSVAVQKKTLI